MGARATLLTHFSQRYARLPPTAAGAAAPPARGRDERAERASASSPTRGRDERADAAGAPADGGAAPAHAGPPAGPPPFLCAVDHLTLELHLGLADLLPEVRRP